MALLEERFHFGLRTREADVATTTLKFGEELNIASSTARERVDGYFRSLARTLADQPQERLDYFRHHLDKAIKARKPRAK